jgi:hypothetical protein
VKFTVRTLLAVLALLMLANAMQADVGGKITGTVKDQTGAVVTGVPVTGLNERDGRTGKLFISSSPGGRI